MLAGFAAGEAYSSSNDMSDLHAMVVHHIGEMICGESIGFHEDGVIVDTINQVQLAAVGFVLARLTIYQVLEQGVFINP